MKSAGKWLLIVMRTHFAVLAGITVSCLCFNVIRPLEERFLLGYPICVTKGMY